MNESARKRIPEMIMAKPEQFDALWDSFQAELKAVGVHKLEEQFQKLLNERIELFSE